MSEWYLDCPEILWFTGNTLVHWNVAISIALGKKFGIWSSGKLFSPPSSNLLPYFCRFIDRFFQVLSGWERVSIAALEQASTNLLGYSTLWGRRQLRS